MIMFTSSFAWVSFELPSDVVAGILMSSVGGGVAAPDLEVVAVGVLATAMRLDGADAPGAGNDAPGGGPVGAGVESDSSVAEVAILGG